MWPINVIYPPRNKTWESQGVKENLEPIDYLFILEKKNAVRFEVRSSGKILLTKPQSIGAIIYHFVWNNHKESLEKVVLLMMFQNINILFTY